MSLSGILEFHACLCHINWCLSSEGFCTDCGFQCNTTDSVFIYSVVFFVVMDLKVYVVDSLQLKPVHDVLQETNSRIQIGVNILPLFTAYYLICCWLFSTQTHGSGCFESLSQSVSNNSEMDCEKIFHASKCFGSPHTMEAVSDLTGSISLFHLQSAFFFFSDEVLQDTENPDKNENRTIQLLVFN